MTVRLPQKAQHDVNMIRRETWNDLIDCVAYAMGHPKGDGHTIRNLGNGLLSDERAGRTTRSSMQGMFQIVARGGDDGAQVYRVIDGANPRDGGKAGVCHVNNQPFEVEQREFDAPSETTYIYLKFVPGGALARAAELSGVELDGRVEDDVARRPTVEIVAEKELKSSTFEETYYLIGRLVVADGAVRIAQDHVPGNVYMLWFGHAVGIGEDMGDYLRG